MTVLAPCPCGKTPKKLFINDNGCFSQKGKWAEVGADGCCSEWRLNFFHGYTELGSDECMDFAIEAWNEAPRGAWPTGLEEQ